MNISIRLENQNDFRNVENMTREAFWNLYRPGCVEHFIIHKIRKISAFIQELDFVACDEDIIVGNIIYSKAKVVNKNKEEFEVLCMGRPLGVLPTYQGKGIGTLLMKHSIKVAKTLGFNAIVLELYKCSLKGISGKYYEDSVFEIDNEELNIFDKLFPYKEKRITDTQL
ncbi:GNAT family N-acetyltransferase [Crassaminicella indica]|uniref:N-acetyltransferase n=1 Tax=Crassaminicella indica TaxID=2855394 RepID=A0ABX8RET9_9CLOT|nr:N-acetyltransferase [Crassaminicella indica]QXM05466.1 N-acetyltransferase [Crassaminicella indica]